MWWGNRPPLNIGTHLSTNMWQWHGSAPGICIFTAHIPNRGIPTQSCVYWRMCGRPYISAKSLEILPSVLKKIYVYLKTSEVLGIWNSTDCFFVNFMAAEFSTHHWYLHIQVGFHFGSHPTQNEIHAFFLPIYINYLQLEMFY